MINWLKKFFTARPKISFKTVDWLDIDSRFRTVDHLAQSQTQTDAKQAIIQADIAVDAVLKQGNVPGQTMGERLKALKTTIPAPIYRKLWQAHIKRNELVHETGAFVNDNEKREYLNSFKDAVRILKGVR